MGAQIVPIFGRTIQEADPAWRSIIIPHTVEWVKVLHYMRTASSVLKLDAGTLQSRVILPEAAQTKQMVDLCTDLQSISGHLIAFGQALGSARERLSQALANIGIDAEGDHVSAFPE